MSHTSHTNSWSVRVLIQDSYLLAIKNLLCISLIKISENVWHKIHAWKYDNLVFSDKILSLGDIRVDSDRGEGERR